MPSNLEKQLAEALRGLVDSLNSEKNSGNPVARSVRTIMKIGQAKRALAEYANQIEQEQNRQNY